MYIANYVTHWATSYYKRVTTIPKTFCHDSWARVVMDYIQSTQNYIPRTNERTYLFVPISKQCWGPPHLLSRTSETSTLEINLSRAWSWPLAFVYCHGALLYILYIQFHNMVVDTKKYIYFNKHLVYLESYCIQYFHVNEASC